MHPWEEQPELNDQLLNERPPMDFTFSYYRTKTFVCMCCLMLNVAA